MNYVLSFLALLVAIAGVLGDTWRDGRPTRVGYGALALALAIFIGSVIKHASDYREQRKIAAIACGQVLRGTHALIFPFAALLADATDDDFERKRISGTKAHERRRRIEEFLSVQHSEEIPSQIVRILGDLPILFDHSNLLKTSSLQDYASELGNGKSQWKEIFEVASRGADTLDTTLSSYRSTMNAGEVGAVQQLRNVWLTQRIETLSQTRDADSLSDFLRLGESRPGSDTTIFGEFLQAAKDATGTCSETPLATGANLPSSSDPGNQSPTVSSS